jgi:hypothetical protein
MEKHSSLEAQRRNRHDTPAMGNGPCFEARRDSRSAARAKSLEQVLDRPGALTGDGIESPLRRIADKRAVGSGPSCSSATD